MCGRQDFVRIGSQLGHLQLVVHVGGSPCPGLCQWNPYKEGKHADASEELLVQMRRITLCLREAFPHSAVEEAEENVAPMSLQDRDRVSAFMGTQPLCFDSSDLRPQRRRRYFWASWGVRHCQRQAGRDCARARRLHPRPARPGHEAR